MASNHNAIILAAGLGTRLKPLTDSKPKALVELWGKPLLLRWLLDLKAQGFDEVAVNIHHFGQQIIDFIKGNPVEGMKVMVSDERDLLLDTGGGIRKAAKLFSDREAPVMVCNVDILTHIDLRKAYERHINQGNDATLLVSHRQTSRYLAFDKDSGRLQGWINKKTGLTKPQGFCCQPDRQQLLAFSGIHTISPALLEIMDKTCPEKFSIVDFYLSVCREKTIAADIHGGEEITDLGKLDVLEKLNSTRT